MPKSDSSAPTPATDQTAHSQHQPATIDGEMLPLRDQSQEHQFDAIDAAARLLVGGTVDLSEIFLKLLKEWEGEVAEHHSNSILQEEEDAGDVLRYLLIGLAFQSQRTVRSSASTLSSFLLGAANTTLSVTRPITQSWLFAPARRSAESVTNQVERAIADLVRTGRAEEFAGRLTAETALQESVDWVLDYVAQNPDVRRLVQQQAVGFTDEIAVGVRSRTITADNVIEGVLRRLFRRTPRADLPGPPQEVKQLEEYYDSREQGPKP